MPTTAGIDTILDGIASLTVDDQEYVLETALHRFHEIRRLEIAERTKEAIINHEAGRTRTGSVEDFLREVDND